MTCWGVVSSGLLETLLLSLYCDILDGGRYKDRISNSGETFFVNFILPNMYLSGC